MAAIATRDLLQQLASQPWRERLERRIELLRRQLGSLCRLAWQLLEAGQLRALLTLLMLLLSQVVRWLRRELLALANACRVSLGMHGDVEDTGRRFGAEPEHIVDLLWRLEQHRKAKGWIATHQAQFLKQQQRLQADIAIRSMLVATTVGMGLLFGTRASALVDAITGSPRPRKPVPVQPVRRSRS